MSRRTLDLSELYDLLRSRTNSYVLCFDMMNLMMINDTYGKEAGDKAIVECLRRIDSLTDDSCLTDIKAAEELAGKITALNGQPILHNNVEIPIGMWVGCTKIGGSNIRYKDLYSDLYKAIEGAKEKDAFYAVIN